MGDIQPVKGLYNPLKNAPIQNVVKDPLAEDLFKVTLDKAVDSLNSISAQEIKADQVLNAYLEGKAPLEEVMIELEKSNVSISLALTVINTTVQTLKEILQMPV